MKKDKYVRRLSTQVTRNELKQFRVARKFVFGHCGKVSDAEVLRYLIRNWDESPERDIRVALLNPCCKCKQRPRRNGRAFVASDEFAFIRGCSSLCQDDAIGETQDQADHNWNAANPVGGEGVLR